MVPLLTKEEYRMISRLPSVTIKTGDKVMLNVERITSWSNFNKKSKRFQEFVANNAGRVFTAIDEKYSVVRLVEEPFVLCDWDLIKVGGDGT